MDLNLVRFTLAGRRLSLHQPVALQRRKKCRSRRLKLKPMKQEGKAEPWQDVDEEDEDECSLALFMGKKNPSKASKEKRQKKEGPERSLAEEGEEQKIKKSEKKKDKKEKKVYDLPGQKNDTPDERDPLKIFFETLYRQLPDNELAATWMMEWGLLPPDEAKMVYEKLQKSLQEKDESPGEAVALEKRSTCSAKKKRKMTPEAMLKAKKRKCIDSNLDGGHGDSISWNKKNNKLKVSI